jgi:predicted Fe-Mo cluster-binding NifX family protein
MKIAVPLSEGGRISPHIGRSSQFLIFECKDSKIVGTELRANTFTPHARGECHDGEHGQGAHSCGSIVEALCDCSAVLCYGMGEGAAQALGQSGVQPYRLSRRCAPEEAVALFLEGKLEAQHGGGCGHHG